MSFLLWVWNNYSRIRAVIETSLAAAKAWGDLLNSHDEQTKAIASGQSTKTTDELNAESVAAAEALLRQYGPERTEGLQQDDPA